MRLGGKRGFDFECKGCILAHSVFHPRPLFFTRVQGNSASVYFRREVKRHAKPLIIAAAPMELVVVGSVPKWRLHGALPLVRRRYRAHFSQVRTRAAAAEREGLRLTEGVGTTSAAWQKHGYARPF